MGWLERERGMVPVEAQHLNQCFENYLNVFFNAIVFITCFEAYMAAHISNVPSHSLTLNFLSHFYPYQLRSSTGRNLKH